MSFVAHKTLIVNGAATTSYVVEYPQIADGNYMQHGRAHKLYAHMEIANMTGGIVYIAFDRPVVPPSGNGVQGTYNTSLYARTGPIAATQGDFDLAISTANGWGALDISTPKQHYSDVNRESQYMTVYCVSAGAVSISFGDQL